MSQRGTRWFENAVMYAIDVEVFQDAHGDGVGDFRGLTERLDYLDHLGVDCLWLLPFYPTPNRDNGYDVTDYYGVDERHGTLGDFVDFVRAAEERGIRVLADLVVNHTSDQHPWFQRAREGDPEYRDYYVWADDPPEQDPERGSVFPGEVTDERVWTYDSQASAYYYHRFYPFQPDLNLQNPAVRDEIRKIMGFWLRLGVAGFRVDAATLMIQEKRPGRAQLDDPHELLEELKVGAMTYRGDVVLAGEADDAPGELPSYVDRGEMDMLFNFVLCATLFSGLATGESKPLERYFASHPSLGERGEWVNFLRNYDELNLGRLPEAERDAVFEALAPDEGMRIYGRGIRRRLAPMLDGDHRRLELAFSLLFSLPGTPLIVYGDEIGMGEDLSLPGRTAVRTPMQWSSERNAGFSTARTENLVRPVVDDGPFAYEAVNVADGWTDEDSLLNFVEHLIGMRHETPEVGSGELTLLDTDPTGVFAHRYDAEDGVVGVAHNLADDAQSVTIDLRVDEGRTQVLLGRCEIVDDTDGRYELDLAPYGYCWLRTTRQKGDAASPTTESDEEAT